MLALSNNPDTDWPTERVIAISGRIASGKSSLADALAKKTGWPLASFGAYVRVEAVRRGLSASRESLQAVGAELVESGPDAFVRIVLGHFGWRPGHPLVIEGVRHVTILDAIRRVVAPITVSHIHVVAKEADRRERLARRGEGEGQLTSVEMHSTERDVLTTLPSMADILVDGAGDVHTEAHRVIVELSVRP